MNLNKLHEPEKINFEEKYDFSHISEIVDALDFLRKEAKITGNEDMLIIVNSAFNLCFSTYYMALRHQNSLADLDTKSH